MRFTQFAIIGLLVVMALPALGASSYLGGFSGAIFTPDEVIVPARTWDASVHSTTRVLGGSDSDLLTIGLAYGLAPNLEVGASLITGGTDKLAVSGKYRLVSENESTPGIAIGVFDLLGDLDFGSGDTSFYLMLSKTITPFATDVAGYPSKPLKMGLGFGSGFYNGIIVNLDWTLQDRLSLLAEYKGGDGGISRLSNRPSVGIRWAASDALRIDAASVGFRDFGFGLSYRTGF